MTLQATHVTTYSYSDPVSICHTEVHLTPRSSDRQTLVAHELQVVPPPDLILSHRDYFGNEVTYFSIHEPHVQLAVTSRSQVELSSKQAPDPATTPAWEQVRADVRQQVGEAAFDAYPYAFESPRILIGREFAAYALEAFTPGRPLMEAALGLSERISREFTYDPRATTVTTPVDEVLRKRHGVCQDFAHLMIACIRSIGLPARYVSGYLRSGKSTKGAEASHAWVGVYCPVSGWMDFDPTNNVMPDQDHITVAWGRDYNDVTPVKGVALGGGDQVIHVEVNVVRVEGG